MLIVLILEHTHKTAIIVISLWLFRNHRKHSKMHFLMHTKHFNLEEEEEKALA